MTRTIPASAPMRTLRVALLASTLGLCLAWTIRPAQAGSSRCRKPVGIGDCVAELRRHCGAPDLVERRSRLTTEGDATGIPRRAAYREEASEHWTYRSPSSASVFTILRGVVSAIEEVEPKTRTACDQIGVTMSTSSAEVLLACGMPRDRRSRVELRSVPGRGRALVTIELWRYGASVGDLVMRFEDGRLTQLLSSTSQRSPSSAWVLADRSSRPIDPAAP